MFSPLLTFAWLADIVFGPRQALSGSTADKVAAVDGRWIIEHTDIRAASLADAVNGIVVTMTELKGLIGSASSWSV